MRARNPFPARPSTLVLGLALAFSAQALVPAYGTEVDAGTDPLFGFVPFSGGEEQPMGMSVKALEDFIDGDLEGAPRKRPKWHFEWTEDCSTTPDMKMEVAPFSLARHEVTNAQWRVFLENPRNLRTVSDAMEWEIGALAMGLYQLDDSDPMGLQQAWLSIYHRNREVLEKVFNPDGVEDFDVITARAKWEATQNPDDALMVPAGTDITYSIIPPPSRKVGFNADGTIVVEKIETKDDEGKVISTRIERYEKRPVHYVSYEDSLQFCLWAGLHLPLEREWEHAARGSEGRRFVWGDEWTTSKAAFKGNATYATSLAVSDGDGFESVEGLRHLAGNVNEWVLDPMRLYPGVDDAATPYDRQAHSVVARGGFFGSDSFTMFAADRIWDAGDPLSSSQRIEGFGFRPAAYSLPMKDYAVLVALNLNDTSGQGPWLYAPAPGFLSAKDRNDPNNWRGTEKKPHQLLAFEPELTAGWMRRQTQDGSGGDHVYITGPAQGIGLLPVKGMLGGTSGLRNADSLRKLAHDKPGESKKDKANEQVCFVGVLIGTANATLHLENEAGEPLTVSFADERFQAKAEKLDYEYPLGAYVVLRDDRVAIYPWNGGRIGQRGLHMRRGRAPIGYLPRLPQPSEDEPGPPTWDVEWAPAAGFTPSSTRAGDKFTLTTLIPAMTVKGEPKLGNADKGAILTLHLQASFTDD